MINGEPATLGQKIDPDKDVVNVNGDQISSRTHSKPPKIYWMLNKPINYLSSRVSQGGKKTIFDLPALSKLSFLIFSVGRLDYKTEGLLLLTNDGLLANKLMHPSYKVPKHYQVFVSARLSKEEEAKIRKGLNLGDGEIALPADIEFVHREKMGLTTGAWYFVTVYEGRNRLVRRLFENVGDGDNKYKVVRLIRYGFGDLRLPEELQAGEYLQLSAEQIKKLKSDVQL